MVYLLGKNLNPYSIHYIWNRAKIALNCSISQWDDKGCVCITYLFIKPSIQKRQSSLSCNQVTENGVRFFFLKFNKATKSSFEVLHPIWTPLLREAEDRESKETEEKSSEKAGRETVKEARWFTLTSFSLGTHHSMMVTSPKMQEKNQAQIRREEAGYASTPAIWLWRKKPNKTPLRRLSKSAAKTRAQPGPSWQPSAPGGPPRGSASAFRWDAEWPELPRKANRSPPRLSWRQCKGRAWPPRGFPAPAVGGSFLSAWCRCLPVTQNLPAQVFGLFLYRWNSVLTVHSFT